MTIGLGQILIVILILILLFGNLPKIIKEIAIGIRNAKQIINQENSLKLEEKQNKNKEQD